MNLKKYCFFLITLLVPFASGAQLNEAVLKYIDRYKEMAQAEQTRVGIPSAIILAQAIFESKSGSSMLAADANNHFGMKCKPGWKGETILHDDDKMSECFKKYKNAQESYTDYANHLKNNRRYSFLFDIPLTQYEDWAIGLRKAGYATDPAYSTKLIELIKKYNLNQYTIAAMEAAKVTTVKIEKDTIKPKVNEEKTVKNIKENNKEKNKTETKVKVTQEERKDIDDEEFILNGLKGFYAKKGDQLLSEAVKRNIRYPKLLQLNDLKDEPLPFDMFIYLEKKHKISPNKRSHVVKEGESMLSISQLEGIQLESLMELNMLENGEQPVVGTRLNLKEKASSKPQIVKINSNPAKNTTTAPSENKPKEVVIERKIEEDISDLIFNNSSEESKTEKRSKKSDDKDETEEKDLIVKIEPVKKEEFKESVMEILNESQSNQSETLREKTTNNEEPIVNVNIPNSEVKVDKKNEQPATTKEDAPRVINATVKLPTSTVEEVKTNLPKSPSTYTEPNVSQELRNLKKIMDAVVYAPPPPPKPKPVIAKDTIKKVVPNPAQQPKTTPKVTVNKDTARTQVKSTNTVTKPNVTKDTIKNTSIKPAMPTNKIDSSVKVKVNPAIPNPSTNKTTIQKKPEQNKPNTQNGTVPKVTTTKPTEKTAETKPADKKTETKPIANTKPTTNTKPADKKAEANATPAQKTGSTPSKTSVKPKGK